jgi:hypothetical protein
MYLIYIDDSGDQRASIYTALMLPVESWLHTFKDIKKFRQRLKAKYGILITKELHATDLIGGRGHIYSRKLDKQTRIEIFDEVISFVSGIRDLKIFNSIKLNSKKYSWAFENLLDRIERTMKEKNDNCLLICDAGDEPRLKKIRRKKAIISHIPSDKNVYPIWIDTGKSTKNTPLEHIIEDIYFKDSKHCQFIQLADFCAYAFFRKEIPFEPLSVFKFQEKFNRLDKVLFKQASRKDSQGIIR